MDKSDVLQKIPCDREFAYSEAKEYYLEDLMHRKKETSAIGCVNWLMEDFYQIMCANGMEKFVIVLVSMLFLIDNKSVDADTAYGAKWDILDFETGEYDSLFSPEDLILIRRDIEIINRFLDANPQMIEGVVEERARTQAGDGSLS